MHMYPTGQSVSFLKEKLKQMGVNSVDIHVVLGSVVAHSLDRPEVSENWKCLGTIGFSEIEGMSASTAPGHQGAFKIYQSPSGKTVSIQQGRLHGYEGLEPSQAVFPVMLFKLLGVQKFILTNASGSLKASLGPGSVLVMKDHINMTGKSPLTGPNPVGIDGIPLGPRFPDMGHVYDKEMRADFEMSLKSKFNATQGVYVGLNGPNFETPAEINLFSNWGGHVVGMSTVWEAIALKHAGAKICGLSMVVNYGCGLVSEEILDHHKFEKLLETKAADFCKSLLDIIDKSGHC